jgi:hypothetical protein
MGEKLGIYAGHRDWEFSLSEYQYPAFTQLEEAIDDQLREI